MGDAPQFDQILAQLVERALKGGVDAAEAFVIERRSAGISFRLGKQENVERAEAADVGLRLFIGKRQAFAASSDLGKEALDDLVERAVSMARFVPEDRFAGLAPKGRLWRGNGEDLELEDPQEPSAERLIELARTAEEAALAVDKVTNSDGGGAGWQRQHFSLVTSDGFSGSRAATSFSVSASVVAGERGGLERDYAHAVAHHFTDLESAQVVGERAGKRAARRLGAAKIKTAAMPVVFEPRVGKTLLGHLAGAVNGQAVARGTSFLRDKMDEKIFADDVTVTDDPRRPRGLASKLFDAEGVTAQAMNVVEDGRLATWLLDTASAAQLGLETTGRASRGIASPPHPAPTNLYLAPGDISKEELIADIDYGYYVTELIGMGVNGITGDYSRGSSGFLIEKGEITKPVSEVTIAGNLIDMFAHLRAADDLEFRYAVNAPTLRIEGMTVAGD